MKFKGRTIYPGVVEGEALVSSMGISFYGGVDPETGIVVERGHALEGKSMAGKVLVFPTGKGSTVGSYTLYRMKSSGTAPLAIVNAECETITAVGCIIADIPCVDRIDIQAITSGQRLRVDGEAGVVEVVNDTARLPVFPVAVLPEPLRGNVPGSFAEDTMSRRLPGIARRVLEETAWPVEAQTRLAALADDLPAGRLRPIIDPGAPDVEQWSEWMRPYLGQTWLDAPWFVAETYFFRRILEATGYFQPGYGYEVDPYRPQKLTALAQMIAPLAAARGRLDLHRSGSSDAHPEWLQSTLVELLRTAIWGNQADLAVFPSDGGAPEVPVVNRRDDHLTIDEANAAAAYLVAQHSTGARVDFQLDNVGLELGFDLVLADFLLEHNLAENIVLHAKQYPTFVSDATISDINDTLEAMASAANPDLPQVAWRLQSHRQDRRLQIKTELFWISPLPGWEMPPDLYAELSKTKLIVSKGDANYRRWFNDRSWPFTLPFSAVIAYRPAPVLALRVFKSNVLAGLAEGRQAELDRLDPEWMYNGKWGVIQFTGSSRALL